MPVAKLKPTETFSVAPQRPAPVTGEVSGVPSPARELQRRLEFHATLSPGGDLQKWSMRRSMALIVASATALWMAMLMAGAQAMRLIA